MHSLKIQSQSVLTSSWSHCFTKANEKVNGAINCASDISDRPSSQRCSTAQVQLPACYIAAQVRPIFPSEFKVKVRYIHISKCYRKHVVLYNKKVKKHFREHPLVLLSQQWQTAANAAQALMCKPCLSNRHRNAALHSFKIRKSYTLHTCMKMSSWKPVFVQLKRKKPSIGGEHGLIWRCSCRPPPAAVNLKHALYSSLLVSTWASWHWAPDGGVYTTSTCLCTITHSRYVMVNYRTLKNWIYSNMTLHSIL
jgi:hypothetical protein